MSIVELFNNLRTFVRPYRLLVIATIILTLIGACTAQVNALILLHVVNSISDILKEGGGFEEGIPLLIFISAILFGKEILNALIQFGQKIYGERLRILISKDLMQAIIEKILRYQLSFFTEGDNESGRLQTRIDRGVGSITRLVQSFFISILPIVASSIFALILMFNANFYVGLVGLSTLPLYYVISKVQAVRLKGWRKNIRTHRENQSQGIISIVDSITVIKSFNREQEEGEKQLVLQNNLRDNEMQTRKVSFIFDGVKTFVDQIGVVLIIILTSYLVLIGEMTIGAIMFHILLFNNVSAPIRQLQRIYDEMSEALIYAEGYFTILDSDEELEPSGSYKGEVPKGNFELKNIDFTYPNGTKALHNISMKIEKGKITALVGLSGAGKSTLISLLDRFYEPDSGIITLDGIELGEYDTQFLRDNIGLVLQKNHIFSGTVEENIRYGDTHATFEDIIEAAKKAHIHNQIMELPEQYASKALQLSGGQQQRIAIARMFIKNPPIIFLDEPTASLDAIATEQIKNSLDAIKKDRTVIIISHSISQIIDADYMYVLKDGRLVEEGTHETAYAQNGAYAEIFDAMARSLNIDKIVDSTKAGK